MQKLTFNLFGRRVQAEHARNGWRLYLAGVDGKRHPLPDLGVPSDISTPEQLMQFLDDHFHEYATPENPSVSRIDEA